MYKFRLLSYIKYFMYYDGLNNEINVCNNTNLDTDIKIKVLFANKSIFFVDKLGKQNFLYM
jgi:hypothetical protein